MLDEYCFEIDRARKFLEKESAWDKLTSILVGYGMEKSLAEHMIAECIAEEYELNDIVNHISDIYHEAKETINNSTTQDYK